MQYLLASLLFFTLIIQGPEWVSQIGTSKPQVRIQDRVEFHKQQLVLAQQQMTPERSSKRSPAQFNQVDPIDSDPCASMQKYQSWEIRLKEGLLKNTLSYIQENIQNNHGSKACGLMLEALVTAYTIDGEIKDCKGKVSADAIVNKAHELANLSDQILKKSLDLNKELPLNCRQQVNTAVKQILISRTQPTVNADSGANYAVGAQ